MSILKASRHASAVAAVCLLFVGIATANPLTYQGTFSVDDEHVSVPINLRGSCTLTAITSSWALGGFAPVLTLFGGAGGYQQAIGSAMTCGTGSGNPGGDWFLLGCDALLAPAGRQLPARADAR